MNYNSEPSEELPSSIASPLQLLIASLLEQLRQAGQRLALEGHPLGSEVCCAVEALEVAISRLITCNPVTGLPDKAAYERTLRRMVQTAQREGQTLVLLLLDSDALKVFNTKYGHPGGDRLLCHVASLLKAGIREGDFAAHLHGDEFAVILVNRSEAEGHSVAERLCFLMGEEQSLGSRATLSVGMSLYPVEAGLADALHILADQRLMVAKELGGNTVIA